MDRSNINTSQMFGVNTSKIPNIKGIVIHNTAGGNSAEAHAQRVKNQSWEQREAGFTHYWVDENNVFQSYDDEYVAWHTGNGDGNYYYIGIEVVDGVNDLRKAENLALELATFLAKEYNLGKNSIRLHNEFSATACPKKSADMHGGYDKVKQDWNNYVNSKLDGNTPEQPKPQPTPQPQPQPSSDLVWQKGTAKVLMSVLNVRADAGLNGEIVASYNQGDTFTYDAYKDADGIRWVSYIGGSGKRRYVARRKLDNSQIYCDAY
jgi:N-acetylmuramoyl-L-alanine amidase CwlA